MENIESYILSGYPIVAIKTDDEHDVLQTIISSSKNKSLYSWDHAVPDADKRSPNPDQFLYEEGTLEEYLSSWADWDLTEDTVVILHNYSCYQCDRSNALLRRLAQDCHHRQHHLTFILFTQEATLSPIISPFSVVVTVRPSGLNFISDEIDKYAHQYNHNNLLKHKDDILFLFNGLSNYEVRMVLNRLICSINDFTQKDEILSLIRGFRKPLLDKHRLLQIIDDESSLDDVGGFYKLKKHLKIKRTIVRHIDAAREKGIGFPKGLLLVGEPGCGKSLVCKAAANYFGLPLLRLDMGKLLGKYLGESEANFQKALTLAENYSPCVLWIDEVEKAFSGSSSSSSGSDVVMRLMGAFLTWLQDRNSDVYVMATANDISLLPNEMFRKGRFDEVFYAGKPATNEEVVNIFEVHLKKRGYADLETICLDGIMNTSTLSKEHLRIHRKQNKATCTEVTGKLGRKLLGMTGAEIEGEVEQHLERWFSTERYNQSFNLYLLKLIESYPNQEQPTSPKQDNWEKAKKIGAILV